MFYLFWLAFLIFSGYFLTLCPTFYFGDSPELSAAVIGLGVPHPPGYPLWVLLSRLFLLLPAGNLAARINFASLFFGTGAIFVFYLLVQLLFDFLKENNGYLRNYSALTAGFLLGFSQIFWTQSVTAEVYALMMFLMVVFLYCLFLFEKSRNEFWYYLSLFLLGLSIAHHELLIIMLPAVFLFLIFNFSKIKVFRFSLLKSILAFLPGFLPFLYLPAAAHFEPVLNWGNPSGIKNFFIHALRLSYPSFFQGSYSFSGFFKQFLFGWGFLFNQFSWFFFAGIFGLFFLARNKKYFWFLIFLFSFFFLSIILVLNFDITLYSLEMNKIFFLPAILIWALFSALGFYAVLKYFFEKIVFKESTRRLILAIFLILVFVFQFGRNYLKCDKSRYYLSEISSRLILASCPKNSILFTRGDNIVFPAFYLKNILKLRPDISIIKATESGWQLSKIPEYLVKVKSFEELKRVSLKLKKPLCYSFFIFGGTQRLLPHGLVYLDVDFLKDRRDCLKLFDKKLLNFPGVPDYFGREVLADIYSKLGDNLLFQGRPQEAIRAYQTGSAIGYDQLPVHSYFWRRFKDLGELEKARNEEKIIQRISADAFQIIKIAVK